MPKDNQTLGISHEHILTMPVRLSVSYLSIKKRKRNYLFNSRLKKNFHRLTLSENLHLV